MAEIEPAKAVALVDAGLLHHPLPSFLLDAEGCVVHANFAAESYCNMPCASMEGSNIRNLIHLADSQLWRLLDDPAKSIAAYGVTLHPGRSLSSHADIVISDALLQLGEGDIEQSGRRIMTINPLPSLMEGGGNRSIGPGTGQAKPGAQAAAILAHEIKNPLSGIKGAAQLIERRSGADAQALTQLICSEVDRIAMLIDRMQDLSQESARACEPQNLYPALFQAREIAKAGFASNITLEEDYDPSLPDVLMDHDAIVQIMLNLLKNACEALAQVDKPRLRISTAFRHGLSYVPPQGGSAVPLPIEVRISDNGPGIPAHLVDAVFNPFVSGRSEGQGLGLALVDKLVRDMGGLVRHRRDGNPLMTHFEIHLAKAKAGQPL